MAPDESIQNLDHGLLSRNLRMARNNQGLSQTELAKRSGVDLASVYRAEKGATVRLTTLRKIAKGLNILFDDLLLEKTVTGRTVPFAVNRMSDAKWFPVEDRRQRVPKDDPERSQDPTERRRVGKFGLVPVFMCPPTIIPQNGPGIVRYEIYDKTLGSINEAFYEDAALYVIRGGATVSIAGTELQLTSEDWVAFKSKDLEGIAILPPHELVVVLWIGSNRVTKPR